MSAKSWQPYALHILDSIARIRQIHARGDIREDAVLYDATLRNILVHNYLGEIDPDTIMSVVSKHLSPLESAVKSMLASDLP